MSEVRLIDANALKYKNLAEVNGRLTYVLTAEEIDNAPTVDIENEVSKQLAKEAREIADENFKYGYEKAKQELEERPQGEWGKHGECPFCSYIRKWEDDNFCGNCGAEMKGGAE